MYTSPLKPLLKTLKNLSYLIGHLFDVEKLKSSDGIVFEKGRLTHFRMLIFFLAVFGLHILTPIYCAITNTRYPFFSQSNHSSFQHLIHILKQVFIFSKGCF
jgi:hypothetical protein